MGGFKFRFLLAGLLYLQDLK